MLDIGFALFLALVAAAVGGRITAALDPGRGRECPADGWLDVLALALPLGFGVMALGVLVLGQLSLLNHLGMAILLGVMLEIGGFWAFRRAREFRARLRAMPPLDWSRADFAMAGLLAVVVCATALCSMRPVTDGDALCYHLQAPKFFLMHGAVGYAPDLHETIYPLVTEMLYTVALECRGPAACRGVQWVLGLVFAAGVTALARPILGPRAWWAGVIALLVPAISNGMSAPLNDVALAAFGTSALLAWNRLHDRPSPRAATLAGVMSGLAIGVKYPALVLVAILFLGILARRFVGPVDRVERRRWLGLACTYAAVLVLVGGCWHLRAYVHTGNPVYPFFKQAFAGQGLDEVLDPIKRPLAVTFGNMLGALGPLTLEPDRFDSFSHQFGPIFLLFLPALLIERAPRRVLILVGVAYLFLMICMTQRQSMRFLLLALGPFAIGSAYLADAWSRRGTWPARLCLGLMFVVLGAESALALVRARGSAGYLLGRESAAGYLARVEPTYRVGSWAGAHLPRAARVIGQDHRGFYIPRDYTMELAHRRRTGIGTAGESARQVVARLREEGFTHLLLCPPEDPAAVEFDPTLSRLLEPWLAERRPLYRERLVDGDGIARRYQIYDLGPRSPIARAPANQEVVR